MRALYIGLVTAVLAVLVGGGMLINGGGDDRERAEPGDVIDQISGISGDTKASLKLPVGQLGIVATSVLDDLDDVDSSVGLAAPEDGGFIGLELSLDDTTSILGRSRPVGDAKPADVTVVAGGKRYPVTAPYTVQDGSGDGATRVPATVLTSGPEAMFVAVAGDPEEISLEVEYDGVTQSVDLRTGDRTTGDAQGLYEPASTQEDIQQDACGEIEREPSLPRVEFVEATCAISGASLLAYTADQGWAPDGERWVVVSVQTRLTGPLRWAQRVPITQDQRLTTYRTTRFTSDVTLNGEKALVEAPTDPAGRPADDTLHWNDRTFTWQVGVRDPMVLRVADSFSSDEAKDPDPEAPTSVRVTFDRSVTLNF